MEYEFVDSVDNNITNRRKWTRSETKALLLAYAEQSEAMHMPIKRRLTMQQIIIDLEAEGKLTQATTVDQCFSRIKTLCRAYKLMVKRNEQRGADEVPSTMPYQDLLLRLFGEEQLLETVLRPKKRQCMYLSGKPTEPLKRELTDVDFEQDPNGSSSNSSAGIFETNTINMSLSEYRRQKLKLKQKYYQKQLQLKEKAEMNKQRRHEEKLQIINQMLGNESKCFIEISSEQ